MQSDKKQFSIFERFAVVGIILLVLALAIQNVSHSVKVSEERTLNNAAVEYAAVKSMYAEQRQQVPSSAGVAHGPAAVQTRNIPVH